MEQELLRKVQLTQLEIAKEIKRVCEENEIPYFLYAGTFLGAVRHQGFIPWDDDMDVAMLREDYERFLKIAPEKLKPEYCLQTWHTDPNYALPFGKVRKRNTLYIEAKSGQLRENGFYVDVFPLDYAPQDAAEREALAGKLLDLFRVNLMKCGYTPWMEEDKILWKKRIGYLYYQLKALFTTREKIRQTYEALVAAVPENEVLYEQSALPKAIYMDRQLCRELAEYPFEDTAFTGPKDYDTFLSRRYGNYMQLPPENERENRHQIVKVEFGE